MLKYMLVDRKTYEFVIKNMNVVCYRMGALLVAHVEYNSANQAKKIDTSVA